MISKAVSEITMEDIEKLIELGIPESIDMEYKSQLPMDKTDSNKKEFLADISSFANSVGGDIIFGIKEEKGVAKEITGIGEVNPDAEILKWEELIRYGIDPRIKVESRILSGNEKNVLLIRIYSGWLKPHRIGFKNTHKFYGRSSAGKHLLSIDELKSAFLSTNTISQQIDEYINMRNFSIYTNDAYIELDNHPKLVFYIIPLGAFSTLQRYDVYSSRLNLEPMQSSGWNNRMNLDGTMTYSNISGDPVCYSYVQVNKNGIIEAVNSALFRSVFRDDERKTTSGYFEQIVINSSKVYFDALRKLEVKAPFAFCLSFIGVKGYRLESSNWRFIGSGQEFTKDILRTPTQYLNEYPNQIDTVLKETFDCVWNAFGYQRSLNYNDDGTRKE